MNGSVVLGRSPLQPNAVAIAKGELTPGQLTQPKSDFSRSNKNHSTVPPNTAKKVRESSSGAQEVK